MFENKLYPMDGATATRLWAEGMPHNACTEAWAMEHPESVLKIQKAYIEAGSRLICAPTFGANCVNIERHGLDMKPEELCRRLVEISCEAAERRALVLGDIGPTGLPIGTSDLELEGIFAEQVRGLELSDIDLYYIESQTSVLEARSAAQAIRDISDRPMIVSFACGGDGRLFDGGDIVDAAEELSGYGIEAVGINCLGNLELLEKLLLKLRQETDIPLIAKPSAGIPKMVDGEPVYSLEPETLAEYARKFAIAGASLIGGCCGTDERHISAIKRSISLV